MKKFFTLTLILTAFFLISTSPISAALDLTVSPVYLDYSPIPGEVIKDRIRIHNNTNSPMNLNLKIQKMEINDRGDVVPADIPAGDSALRWFKFNSTQITAPAKEWYDVPFTITVPTDSAFGNYFAIDFSAQTVKPSDSATVIQGDVLVPVLINVKKDGTKAEAQITDFKVDGFVSEYMPINFTVTVKNTGNVHVHPSGNIFIRGNSQKDLAVLQVNSGLGNILPNTNRNFFANWSDGFIVREKNSEGTGTHLIFNWNKLTSFRIGKYSAYVLLAYDDGHKDVPIEANLTFWVFPYKAVAAGLAIIVLLLVGVSKGLKALVRNEAKKLQS